MVLSEAVEFAISDLANAMRLYVESQLRFSKLVKVDPEEAIDNVDRAFELKLEKFHSLHDITKSQFAYFENGDALLLLTIRNAIHHRNHPLFASLNKRMLLDAGSRSWSGASFLKAKHLTDHEGEIIMAQLVRLDDIDARIDASLGSPFVDTKLNRVKALKRNEVINEALNLEQVRLYAKRNRYPSDQVYIDLMPIYVSATCKVFKSLSQQGFQFRGFDAETYHAPFTKEISVNLKRLEFERIRVGW